MLKMINEIYGLVATSVVLVSFMFQDIIKIRLVNLLGASMFVFYGVMIGAPSVYILNGAIMGIQVYKIYNLIKK